MRKTLILVLMMVAETVGHAFSAFGGRVGLRGRVVNPAVGLAALALVLALGGCAPQAAPKETLSLKVGVLPIVDVLPMYVAEQEGYFKEQNLQVELVLFPSALERDSAFVAGQIDGELNDPISTALLNKDGEKAKIVRLACPVRIAAS